MPNELSFNPRPALIRGATSSYADYRELPRSFNPRPALTHGATAALPTGSLADPYYAISAKIAILPECAVVRLPKNSEKAPISLKYQWRAKSPRLSRHLRFAPRFVCSRI